MNDQETPREHIFRNSLYAEKESRRYIETSCSCLAPGVLIFEMSQDLQAKGVDFTLYVNGTRITLQLKGEVRSRNSFFEQLQIVLDKGAYKTVSGNIQTTTADYYLIVNFVSGYLILVDRWGWAEFGQCQLTKQIKANPAKRLLYAVANITRNLAGKRELSRAAFGHPVSNLRLLWMMRKYGIFFRIFDIRALRGSEHPSLQDYLAGLKYPKTTPSQKSLSDLSKDIEKGADDYLRLLKYGFDIKPVSRLPEALLSLKPSKNAGRLLLERGPGILQSAASFSLTSGGDDYDWPTIPIGPGDESVAAVYGGAPIIFTRPTPSASIKTL